jgi:flavin reductase (DIM6/NTAB) family NADH-FMN oxidoreductase RutF
VNNQVRDNFRHCMRRLAATVCVITCQHEGMRYGITATAVTSLCFDPVSILACINSSSSLLQPLLASGKYCINLLSNQHTAVSQRFSTPLSADERFAAGEWRSNAQGVPYLADAQATLFCELDQTLPYATHHIVIGQVSDCQFSEAIAPLLYQNGAYVTSAPLTTPVAG